MTRRQDGFTLIEVVMVIVILGILATVAFRSLGTTVETARIEETKQEMTQLAFAMAGNPELLSNGNRIDFGYLGDVGALPPDWEALAVNPGLATWKGPYISDGFVNGSGNLAFMLDAWGVPYSTPASYAFSSTGGSETITRLVANSLEDLLDNQIVLYVSDADYSPPGTNAGSIRIELMVPDGAGGTAVRTAYPEPKGSVSFDSVPIGIHDLRMIYLPAEDTLMRKVTVNPGRAVYLDLRYYADAW